MGGHLFGAALVMGRGPAPRPHDVAGFDGVEDLGGHPFKAALVMVPGLEPRRARVRRGGGFGRAPVRGSPCHGSGPGPTTWPGSTGWRIWASVHSRQPLSWFRVWNHDVWASRGSQASHKSATTRRLQNGTSLSCFRVWNHDVHGRNRMHLTCGWSLGSADMSWAFVFTLARHGSGPGSVTKSGSLESALSSWVALALGHCHLNLGKTWCHLI